MRPVPAELRWLLQDPRFKAFHAGCAASFGGDVNRFLAATLDEVRTATSGRIALAILAVTGMTDFGIFREAVLRRELTATIDFKKHRDHSSHTLYNYLLGWYFFSASGLLRSLFRSEFQNRGGARRGASFPFSSDANFFGCVWQYVSLLHDIGYMFEGDIPALAFATSSRQANIGSGVVGEYFNRLVWLDYGLDLPAERERLFEAIGQGTRPPAFPLEEVSLGAISERLRDIGDLRALFDSLRGAKKSGTVRQLAEMEDKVGGDAFELWIRNYEHFGRRRMARRMRSLRRVFNTLIDRGLPGVGVRLLDHGVCSGLVQLLGATYYYRLRAAAESTRDSRLETLKRLRKLDWSPEFWWAGIVWASGAAAVHNVQQMAAAAGMDANWPGRLRLQEDPLAYLGVLVDILEEWDRYSVFKGIDKEPIQGIDVALGRSGERVLVRFLGDSGPERARQVRKSLSEALASWHRLVEVLP